MPNPAPAPAPDATAQPPAGTDAGAATPPQPPHPPRPRTRRLLLALLLLLPLLPLLLIGGALIWAGSEGSLATALRWLARSQPLQAEGVRGSLLAGGQAQALHWQQNGLHIRLQNATLHWRPAALWQRQLHITTLSASHLHISDQRPPDSNPPAPAPPQSLALPLHIRLDTLRLDALHWAGPPAIDLQNLAAQYRYDGSQHHLRLQNLRWQSGPHHAHGHAQASLSARHPIALQLTLAAHLTPGPTGNPANAEPETAPAATAPPLQAQATLQGPLSNLTARALLRQITANSHHSATLPALPALDAPLTPPEIHAETSANAQASGKTTAIETPPQAATPSLHLQARLTPWAAQPLPAAHARLHAFDAAALAPLWPAAPRTQLSGVVNAQPQNPSDPSAPTQTAWALQADIANTDPGPWDQARLPLSRLQARAQWHAGAAQVQELIAHIGQGRLQAHGHWRSPDAHTPQTPPSAQPPWRINAQLHALNPALLHTRLAPLLLDGSAAAHPPEAPGDQTAAQAIDFQLDLKTRAHADAAATPAAQQALLQLRQAATRGRWQDGLLTLRSLNLRTHDAQLSGQASLRLAPPAAQATAQTAAQTTPPSAHQAAKPLAASPAHLGGQADLRLQIPGAHASIQGALHHASGQGALDLNLQDAARTLAWARQLPGAGDALHNLHASGAATLNIQWQGGWRDPAVQARLHTPRLALRLPASAAPAAAPTQSAAAAAPATQAAEPTAISLQDLRARLSGRLSQWQLDLQGQARQPVPEGARQLDLRLAASGGRSSAGKSLATSGWRFKLSQLQASVRDPALPGPGPWRIALQAPPVDVTWLPAQGGRLNASAGQLHLSSPAPAATAVLAWQPLHWHAGQWQSAGSLRGLPLAWAEQLSGQSLSQAGLDSDLILDGGWNLRLTDTLHLQAHLARASGDLRLHGSGGQRLSAGVRSARIELSSQGPDLTVQLQWDTQRAGTASGRLQTRLSHSAPDAAAPPRWHWPADAPLNGQLKASLPQLSVWSAFAPPGWRLNGAVQADVQIAGARSQPRLSGPLQADQLALRSVVDGIQLQNGHLRARLDGERLLIDEFLLRGPVPQGKDTPADGGHIRASGQAGWIDGRLQASLSATLTRLRASLRDDRQVTLSGQAQARLENHTLHIGGQLNVDQALILLPEDSAPRLGDDVIVRGPGGKVMYGKQAPATVAEAAPAEKPGNPAAAPLQARGSVRINLGDNFRLQGLGVNTRLAGELTLSADGPLTAMPRLSGTVRTVGGVVHAYGQRLDIQRGHISFSGDAANPRLDILALRPNFGSDQRVGAQVQGTALLPHVRLYSQPALSESETLAWLLLGRPAPSTGAEAAMLQSAALALLGGRESKGLAATFGLDELSFARGEDGDFASASVTLGKRLSDRLYAAYEYSLAGAGGTLMVFYELSRRWSLRGQAGANMALDLIFRLSF